MSNPTPNEPRTPVIFRRFANGEIIAIFPTIPGTNSPNTCTNYMHTGQHGTGSDSLAGTKAASPEQYASLKTELTAIGYKLEIRYRVTDNDRRERRAELARMEPPSC